MPSLPSSFQIREIRVLSNSPNWREEPENLNVSIRSKNAHRWDVNIVSTKMRKIAGRILFGELLELQGGEPFKLVLPGYTDRPNGHAGGSPSIRTNAQSGVTNLQLKNGTPNQLNQHLPGDYFRVVGHQKVYMITKVANTNGQGQTTIHFRPGLKKPAVVDTLLELRDVALTLRIARDPMEFTARSNDGELVHYELDCIEDLR